MRNGFEDILTTQRVVTLQANTDGRFVVDNSAQLFGGDYERSGHDLLISGADGVTLRLPGYFAAPQAVDLYDAQGAVLRGALVERLAGSDAPDQYAQADAPPGPGPIGQVETLSGPSTVTRADGTRIALEVGVKIYQNDLVETTSVGGVSVTFVDGTIFTLAASSRMVIDDLVYDPNANDNGAGFNLIQGSFVFIAGQIAKTGGMEVSTPSATMGIRGTTVIVKVATVDGITTSEFTLTEDPDGETGEVLLFALDGALIATINETDTKWIVSPENGEQREVPRSLADTADDGQLVAMAFAAYTAAFDRVDAGDTFVTLPTAIAPQQIAPETTQDPQSLDIDGVDEPDNLDTPQPAPPPAENSGDGEIEEGLLTPDALEVAPVIVVQGLEDATEDSAISGSVVSGGVLRGTVALIEAPQNGQVSLDGNGGFSFVPDANFNGDDRFKVQITDPNGDVVEVQVIAQVLAVNDTPVAGSQALTLVEDGVISGLIPASDIDGDALSYAVEAPPENGLLTLLPDGSYAYVPDENYAGTDQFSVRVSDPAGASALSIISLTVQALNDAPIINPGTAEADGALVDGGEVFTVSGALSASDPDPGDMLFWQGSTSSEAGVFEISEDGRWTYEVDPDALQALGENEVLADRFAVTVQDVAGATDARDVVVTLTGANDAPVLVTEPGEAQGTLLEGEEDTRVSGTLRASDADANDTVRWTGESEAGFGTFTLLETGEWTYDLDNTLADALSEGDVLVERLIATGTDNSGASVSQTVEVTLRGTNDAPVLSRTQAFEIEQGDTVSATLSATDPDGTGVVTFEAMNPAAANGVFDVSPGGTFTFTPASGFLGVERLQYRATDSDGAVSVGTIEVIVESAEGAVGEQTASVSLNTVATEDTPAHAIDVAVQTVDASSVNLAIALDRSGSILQENWDILLQQVDLAVADLANQFAGSETDVEVSLITFATDSTTFGPFDLQSDQLSQEILSLPYNGGLTFWNLALDDAADFFFSGTQNETDANFLLFVTDGRPSNGAYRDSLATLQNPNDAYSVNIQAFGYGDSVVLAPLNDFEVSNFPDGVNLPEGAEQPDFFDTPEKLTAALQNTPIFNPEFVGFSVDISVDGADAVTVFSPDPETLALDGSGFEFALAEIEGLADILGAQNRVDVRTQFDLNNDPATAEIDLFNSDVIGKAATAQDLSGFGEADLLFGSDLSDTLSGAGGNDVLLGYEGDDILDGGAGADAIRAGDGDDTVRVLELATDGSEDIDGGAGRDTLVLGATGDINALIAAIDFSNIEVLDIANAQEDRLSLTLEDIEALMPDEGDAGLEELVAEALPTVYGDAGDTVEARLAAGSSIEQREGVTLDGEAGADLSVYDIKDGSGIVLATLAVESDVAVEMVPVA
ncbi:MAG: Ig-like domain-containing protein [Roseobacter sp.]